MLCFKGIRSTVVTNSYAGEKEDLLEHSQIQGRGLESGTAGGGGTPSYQAKIEQPKGSIRTQW